MNKLFSSKYWWIILLLVLVVVNYLASIIHFRIDLTEEKRYTLSTPTKRLLRNLKEPVSITVFLSGDMPAGFKKLSQSAEELLAEFREIAGNKLQFKFEKPGEGLDDTAKTRMIDSLYTLGISPTNVKAQVKSGESQQEQFVYPGALITSRGRTLGVDLLKGQSYEGGLNSLNKAEALLEYKFTSAIQKATTDSVPVVGYLIGNGQPLSYNVYDLVERTLKPNYGFGFLPIDSVAVIPPDFEALLIVKPTKKFTDEQKLKLDQYVMHGGKIIWLIDELYAEFDSLQRSNSSDFVAYDRGLNLEDILFKYGVRINQDLVQDLQCERIPVRVGNMGNQPQFEFLPFPYFPLLSSYSNHPVSKNLDHILSIFPNSIDTVKSTGIRKTVLLASSENSRTLSTPAIVTLKSTRVEEDRNTYVKKHIPVAVLLEGKFNSLYANRISSAKMDSMSRYNYPFLPATQFENKMIVISDADIVLNVVTQNEGPLSMGMHQFNKYQYANKDFFLNCVEYLVNPSGILETRAKNYTLRLLDVKKTEEQRTSWQLLNIGAPIILILVLGLIFSYLRKRKYADDPPFKQ